MINLSFTIIAIISAVFGAGTNILARTVLKEIKTKDMLGISFLTVAAVLLLISPVFYFFKLTIFGVLLLILVAIIDLGANFFFFKIFEKTEASVATPLISLAPVFAFFFGWVLISEKVNLITFLISVAIVVLVILFSVETKNIKEFKTNTLFPGLMSALLYGLSAIPAKILLTNLQVINSPTLYMFRAGLIALFALLIFRIPIRQISAKQYRGIFFQGLFAIAQWILLYFALSKGSAGVTITLAYIIPIFTFIFGIVFLKEKPTLKKGLAAILILILSFVI